MWLFNNIVASLVSLWLLSIFIKNVKNLNEIKVRAALTAQSKVILLFLLLLLTTFVILFANEPLDYILAFSGFSLLALTQFGVGIGENNYYAFGPFDGSFSFINQYPVEQMENIEIKTDEKSSTLSILFITKNQITSQVYRLEDKEKIYLLLCQRHSAAFSS